MFNIMLSNIILTSIYVLALQDNKYFISKLSKEKGDMIDSFILKTNTTNLHSIFGNGAYWLELYPIVKVDKIIEEEVEDYDYIVKDYMATFGAHNVRGGSFNDIVFQQEHFFELVKELNQNYNRDNIEKMEYEELQNNLRHEELQNDLGQEELQNLEEYTEKNNHGHLNQDDDDGYKHIHNDYEEI